jgi:RNA polymerase sigma-70 factor (ECF subfamily)
MAQKGDRQAYATLLTVCRDWLLRYFRRKIHPEQLEDLVQETLLSVHRKLASYDPSRPFYPWLAAISRYRFVDHLRCAYRLALHHALDEDASAIPADEPAITAKVSLDRLFEALPEAQHAAIDLVKLRGLSIREAARRTGQSEALVKVNIHRGLKRLAGLIEEA